MTEELTLLKLICYKLEQAGIPYMVTGSLAANFFAVPRMTRDIDIVIAIMPSHIRKIVDIFSGEFYIDEESVAEAIKYQSSFNIIYNPTVFKIDFIVRKDSEYARTEFKRKIQVKLDGGSIWVVSPEDLVLAKLAWAKDSKSQTQLNDIKNLLMHQKQIDKDYLANWIRQLDLSDIYQIVEKT